MMILCEKWRISNNLFSWNGAILRVKISRERGQSFHTEEDDST